MKHVHCAKAARLARIGNEAAKKLKARVSERIIIAVENNLLLLSLEELVKKKPGSGAKLQITED